MLRFFVLFLISCFAFVGNAYADIVINTEPYFVGGLSMLRNSYTQDTKDQYTLPSTLGAGFAGFGAFVSDRVALEMTIRYSPTRNKLDSSGSSTSVNSTVFNWDMLYYFSSLRDIEGGGIKIFLLGGVAFVAQNISSQSSPGAASKSIGNSGWGYNAGGGVEYDISNRSAVRFDVRYTGLVDHVNVANIVSGNIGLRFKF